VSGRGDDADRDVLAGIGQPGSVALSCYPAERTVSRAAAGAPLHLLVAELHDAQRHIVRLCGIYAASTCESLLSLEDPAMQALLPPVIAKWFARGAGAGGELPSKWSRWLTRYAQAALERVAQKLGEEGVELALAAVGEPDDKVIGEAADLLFHLLVLLRSRGLRLEQVMQELRSRQRTKVQETAQKKT